MGASGSSGTTASLEGAGAGAAIGSVVPGVGTLLGAGIGASIGGILSSSSDQQALDNEKAQVAEEQAAEIQQREVANENLRDQQAYRQKLQFGASFAGSGKAGTGIGSQLEIQREADQTNMVSNRDSQFQQSMLLQQAGIDTTLGAETAQAGEISAISTGLSGATKLSALSASGSKPGISIYSPTQDLPDANSFSYTGSLGTFGGP
jgi:phage tail tape-measure protein